MNWNNSHVSLESKERRRLDWEHIFKEGINVQQKKTAK